MEEILSLIQTIDSFFWQYVGIFFIIASGLYLSFKSGFVQLFGLHRCFKNFFRSFGHGHSSARGAPPILVFFASLGGCIGIGNVVSIAVAIQLGGPGAIFWVWLAALLGMIIKYAEVYLGIKFRVENDRGSYDGGPMYFLRYAFPHYHIVANLMALLMCIYGTEIYLFSVIKESLVINFSWPPGLVVALLLGMALFTVLGGVRRVGIVNTWLVSVFIVLFVAMVSYILLLNAKLIPQMLLSIISSAFTGHAAAGGFLGSSLLMTMSRGVSSACYSGDVAIGYASIIQAETNIDQPEKQASLAIVGIFLDTIVMCTAVMLLVMITGVWEDPSIKGSLLVQSALAAYFPRMDIFMPLFIFALGFSTITSYMLAGIKAAKFLGAKRGKLIFICLSSLSFVLFSIYDPSLAMGIMYICGGFLIFINIVGILKLRRYISFDF